MFKLILASSVLLSWVIDLVLWQGIVVVLFCSCVYLTGRMMSDEEYLIKDSKYLEFKRRIF